MLFEGIAVKVFMLRFGQIRCERRPLFLLTGWQFVSVSVFLMNGVQQQGISYPQSFGLRVYSGKQQCHGVGHLRNSEMNRC